MNLIVVEGLDGAGKSTQIRNLIQYFGNEGKRCKYLHFPRSNAPFFGELVSRFLRGEFGKLEDVDPYLVAMIYAGDRKDASAMLSEWLRDGYYVLLDRYVYSNIAYQCAKTEDLPERERLQEWIMKLEFDHFGIPRPSLNIFLDVPFAFTEGNLNTNRSGDDREYLQGSADIHEMSLNFQKRVRQVYLDSAVNEPTLEILNCAGEDGNILSQGEIFIKITELLKRKKLV